MISSDTSGGIRNGRDPCGTHPDTNIALVAKPAIQFTAEGAGYETDVPMCGTINVD